MIIHRNFILFKSNSCFAGSFSSKASSCKNSVFCHIVHPDPQRMWTSTDNLFVNCEWIVSFLCENLSFGVFFPLRVFLPAVDLWWNWMCVSCLQLICHLSKWYYFIIIIWLEVFRWCDGAVGAAFAASQLQSPWLG